MTQECRQDHMKTGIWRQPPPFEGSTPEARQDAYELRSAAHSVFGTPRGCAVVHQSQPPDWDQATAWRVEAITPRKR